MRNKALTFWLLLILFYSCNTRDCTHIPEEFSSYRGAIKIIKGSSFKIRDSINVNSIYIKSANYYSCDGEVGFFLYKRTSGSEYFNSKVPIGLWQEFKKSESKDSFYEDKISKYTSIKVTKVKVK